jgi:hypothetical protein
LFKYFLWDKGQIWNFHIWVEVIFKANNMNKLLFVGMQLPEKYKENFDVSSEDPSSGLELLHSKHRNSLYIFQVVAYLRTKACSYYWPWKWRKLVHFQGRVGADYV